MSGSRPLRRPTAPLPRHLHPAAWWLWAVGLAVACSTTTNPLLLLLAVSVAGLVVAARRGSSPWARAFRLYLWLGAGIVVLRVVLHLLVGLKVGQVLLYRLPSIDLPGITLLGPLYLEGLLGAAVQGLRLAAIIACVGAANALADPKRLLRALPGALHEVGAAVVVSVTVAPQLAESVQRVSRARALRGESGRGLRAVGRVALPVLQDTLERSLALASAMDSRGYGRVAAQTPVARASTGVLTLGGLVGAAIGSYAVLDPELPRSLGPVMLAIGVVLVAAGLAVGGRAVRRTTYRPDPWAAPEWVTALSGIAAVVALLATARTSPEAVVQPLLPLAPPALPLLAVAGLLLAAIPAVAAPAPPAPRRRAREAVAR